MKKKLFVLSIDAMVREDVEYMMTKPNFSKLMDKRAEVTEACTVYPALTYPAHTSLLTGCRPGKTGIYTNQPLKTYKDAYSHFYMEHKDIKVEDFFAIAKRAGCSTACCYWPVTANNPNIDCLITEYYFYLAKYETVEEAFARYGSNEAALKIVREHEHLIPEDVRTCNLKGSGPKARFKFDDFINACTVSMIRDQKPDVMFAHCIYLDTLRHGYGLFSQETKEAMDKIDEYLGDIIQAMKDIGTYEDTNFVIVSDHGQLDFERYVKLNALLQKGGFIDLAPDGSVYNWSAFSKTSGFSTAVFLADPTDKKKEKEVYEYLLKLKDEGIWGIEEVLPADEVRERWGTYGMFSFIVEAESDTCFADGWEGQISQTIYEVPGYKAKHGYQPEKGPQPIILATGPDFKEGAVIPHAYTIDLVPTLAAIYGQEAPEAEGKCLRELLK